MPILAIILTAYLFFFVAVALIAVAGFLDSRDRRRRAMGSARPLAGVTAEQSFNPRFMALWEQPLSALRMVSESGNSGIAYVRLRPCFARAARRFPEMYDGCTLEQWVGCLEREELISWNADRVMITRKGEQFLHHHFNTGAILAG